MTMCLGTFASVVNLAVGVDLEEEAGVGVGGWSRSSWTVVGTTLT